MLLVRIRTTSNRYANCLHAQPMARVATEIEDDAKSADAARVAHRLGGIVANDDRIRAAIQAAIEKGADAQRIVAAVTKALLK
jgi:hypothetical protein